MSSSTGGPDDLAAKVAHALADQFLLLYEIGVRNPRVRRDGDLLAFSFEGGLTAADETLIDNGSGDQIRAFRESFLETVADQLGAVVGAMTGTRVVFFSGAFDVVPRTTNCYFTLAPDPKGAVEQDSG